ncbi:MAG: hypothetical protein QOF87_383 [Pseudonocardiales bacterium]|jgi:uncharacterized membrane protein YkoI|nr:hypothetical protein [Pseudonocardiales bacterium]MDT4976925.1 hypothetical protein [Pseudonocardiales bacterium]
MDYQAHYQAPPNPSPPKRTNLGLKIALVSAGLAAGAVGATAMAAGAQSTTTAGAPSTSTTTAAAPNGAPAAAPGGGHGAAPVRSDEKAVTTAQAATLKAAALKAVPGGTVYRIETDAGDGVYEAHMTKADGTEVTVKFDKNLAVTKVETGMGAGDPRGNH